MTETVQMTITGCDVCPNQQSERYYTADSFENIQEWKCEMAGFQRIALHEWNDPKPAIPAWCPLRSNAK
jgi:hypothetical protein